MWIKKIKKSLTLRIFWITVCLLSAACFLTYAFIALAMPISYNGKVSEDIAYKTEELVMTLEQVPLQEWGPLVDDFTLMNEVNINLLYDGNLVEIPGQSISVVKAGDKNVIVTHAVVEDTARFSEVKAGTALSSVYQVAITSDWESEERSAVLLEEINTTEYLCMKIKDFFGSLFMSPAVSFTIQREIIPAGEDKVYELEVGMVYERVNQVAEAIGTILPQLAGGILCVSVLGALLYSRYITRPIVTLNGISRKMADLDFSWKCSEKREDEIGELARSFNVLSEKLSSALEQLQEANLALKEDIDREREMERQRMMFFSAVSHELKTPITIMKGQLEGMIGNIGVYRDRDKYLDRSLETACRMEGMVQEILTVSRMESDFTIQKKEVDLSRLVEVQAGHFRELAEQKQISLQMNLEESLMVYGDPALLKRVADNLLSNALNYSPEGERVFIAVRKKDGKVFFMVENTGVTIPEDCLPHLFEAFYRVEKSRSRKTGGSGLGLYLVKMILDRHGAACTIENTAGGVLVSVSMPVLSPSEQKNGLEEIP